MANATWHLEDPFDGGRRTSTEGLSRDFIVEVLSAKVSSRVVYLEPWKRCWFGRTRRCVDRQGRVVSWFDGEASSG